MKFSASILSADYLNLGRDIGRAAGAGCAYLHIDVMDGHFVPNIAVGVCTVEALKNDTRLVSTSVHSVDVQEGNDPHTPVPRQFCKLLRIGTALAFYIRRQVGQTDRSGNK